MAKEKRNVKIIADSRIERGLDDKESIIFSADGTIEDDGEKITVRYTEPGNEDTKATRNEISFLKESCGEVTISRRGGINSLMMFKRAADTTGPLIPAHCFSMARSGCFFLPMLIITTILTLTLHIK